MSYIIRKVTKGDESTLWQMLFYASHMHEQAGKTLEDAKFDGGVSVYVESWGRDGDLGYIAVDDNGKALGSAWVRLFKGTNKAYSQVDDNTPELAIAVLLEYTGKGIGTQLMQILLDDLRTQYLAVMLNVRADNPALRLYQRLGFCIIREMTNRVGTLSYDMVLRF
jgi:ribosomal protein S18 acetylase RimI-like enzyme